MTCNPIIASIEGCARCWGEGHDDIEFHELTHSVEFASDEPALTHWATCPTTGEPILMSIVGVEVPVDV